MQRCFTFQLSVSPRARIFSYPDHLGNLVHHFDIPGPHKQLTIIADALVEVDEPEPLPSDLGLRGMGRTGPDDRVGRLLGHAASERLRTPFSRARSTGPGIRCELTGATGIR